MPQVIKQSSNARTSSIVKLFHSARERISYIFFFRQWTLSAQNTYVDLSLI